MVMLILDFLVSKASSRIDLEVRMAKNKRGKVKAMLKEFAASYGGVETEGNLAGELRLMKTGSLLDQT